MSRGHQTLRSAKDRSHSLDAFSVIVSLCIPVGVWLVAASGSSDWLSDYIAGLAIIGLLIIGGFLALALGVKSILRTRDEARVSALAVLGITLGSLEFLAGMFVVFALAAA